MSEQDDAALAAAVEAANATPSTGEPAESPRFDPDAHNVAAVKAHLAQADDAERQRVLELERAGQAPKGILGSADPATSSDADEPEPVEFAPIGKGKALREVLPDDPRPAELAPRGDDELADPEPVKLARREG